MKTFGHRQTDDLGSKFRKGKQCCDFSLSAQVDLEGEPSKISGGGLKGTYTAVQFHFHWGSSSDKGSEHTIDGKQYPLEVWIPKFFITPFRPPSHTTCIWQPGHSSNTSCHLFGIISWRPLKVCAKSVNKIYSNAHANRISQIADAHCSLFGQVLRL